MRPKPPSDSGGVLTPPTTKLLFENWRQAEGCGRSPLATPVDYSRLPQPSSSDLRGRSRDSSHFPSQGLMSTSRPGLDVGTNQQTPRFRAHGLVHQVVEVAKPSFRSQGVHSPSHLRLAMSWKPKELNIRNVTKTPKSILSRTSQFGPLATALQGLDSSLAIDHNHKLSAKSRQTAPPQKQRPE